MDTNILKKFVKATNKMIDYPQRVPDVSIILTSYGTYSHNQVSSVQASPLVGGGLIGV